MGKNKLILLSTIILDLPTYFRGCPETHLTKRRAVLSSVRALKHWLIGLLKVKSTSYNSFYYVEIKSTGSLDTVNYPASLKWANKMFKDHTYVDTVNTLTYTRTHLSV